MATEFDRVLLAQHFEAALALPAAKRWSLERDARVPLGVFCTMHPRTAPGDRYKVQLRWTDYLKPPSVKFVNLETNSESDASAWPNVEGSRPTSFFVCAPWTKEGHEHHPEWAASVAGRYSAPEEPLVFMLLQLQHLMDNTFQGRGA
jgi:hypothetical protein